MKKLVMALALMAVFAVTVSAEEGKTKSITTNPVGMIFKVYNANFQFHIADKIALGAGGVFWKPADDFTMGGANISGNYYSKGGLEGFWAQPSLRLGYASYTINEYINDELEEKEDGSLSLDLGAVIGYRWTWGSGYTMGLAGGYQWGLIDYDGYDIEGARPKIVWDLGYAF